MISKDKAYRTRDGREVRIYATDGGGEYPVHGAILAGGRWMISKWQQDGAWNFPQSDHDLIEVRPRHQRTVWLHVYTNGYVEASNKPHWRNGPCINGPYDGEKPIACIKVDLDFAEGDGL